MSAETTTLFPLDSAVSQARKYTSRMRWGFYGLVVATVGAAWWTFQ